MMRIPDIASTDKIGDKLQSDQPFGETGVIVVLDGEDRMIAIVCKPEIWNNLETRMASLEKTEAELYGFRDKLLDLMEDMGLK